MSRRVTPPVLHGPAAPVLARLFAAQGLPAGAWWPFHVQQEGKRLPGGLEALSGFVLTAAGDVYGWWLDWAPSGAARRGVGDGGAEGDVEDAVVEDGRAGGYVFDRWWRVIGPEREFGADAEYRRARRGLGLD
jgi:hypothetical protein